MIHWKPWLLEMAVMMACSVLWAVLASIWGIGQPWMSILCGLFVFTFLMSPWGVRFRDWCWDATHGK